MAFNVTTSYAGKFVNEFYSSAIYNAGSVARVSILPNVKSTMRLPRVELGSVLQADSCGFNASGDVTLTEKSISVADLKINVELCKTDLEASFYEASMRAGAMNSDIPSDLQSYILDLMKTKIANNIESLMWVGSVSGGSLIDGIYTKAVAETAVNVAAATTLDDTTVVAELYKVVDAAPAAVATAVENGGYKMKIFVDYSIAKAYRLAVAKKSNEDYTVKNAELNFLGYELVVAPLGTKKMIAADPSQLYLATDLFEDTSTIDVVDMSVVGEDNVRFKSRFKLGAAYRLRNEMVVYG